MNLEKKDNQKLLQLVSFKLGDEEFGIEILSVQEIIRLINITKVPNSNSFVEGIINLRGKVIPVINIRVKLNMEKIENTHNTRIIVVDINNKTVGFIVDSVNEVLRISRNIIEAPPSITTSVDSEYITAVGKLEDKLLILLDLQKALSMKEQETVWEVL